MKVRIFKPHTHAGIEYTPGPDGIEIDNVAEHDVQFMRDAAVLTRPEAEPSAGARAPAAVTDKPRT